MTWRASWAASWERHVALNAHRSHHLISPLALSTSTPPEASRPRHSPQEVKLTLRQKGGDGGPVVTDVSLTREEVPVKPKAGTSSFDGPAGGLFAGTVGPKPPPALWLAMAGMREGGRRTVQVPADVGYEDVGSNEIPPNADFTLDIELVAVKPAGAT